MHDEMAPDRNVDIDTHFPVIAGRSILDEV